MEVSNNNMNIPMQEKATLESVMNSKFVEDLDRRVETETSSFNQKTINLLTSNSKPEQNHGCEKKVDDQSKRAKTTAAVKKPVESDEVTFKFN